MRTIVSLENYKFLFDKNNKENNIKVLFYENYYFFIPKEELDKIGSWKIKDNNIILNVSEKKAYNKINHLIEVYSKDLRNNLHNKRTIFIKDIPLIGSNEFGLIDRGTNVIEIKPLTGCNLNCIYCSVDEGINKKIVDYLVDIDDIIEYAKFFVQLKKNKVEFNIGPHGEPFLYPKLVELVKRLKELGGVVSINTNGTLLNKDIINKLKEAGLDRLNISLNTLNQEKASKLANTFYPLKKVIENILYANKIGINILLAPIYVPKFNEDLSDVVEFSRKLKSKYPVLGIQNFLNYKKGRNPIKADSWDKFYKIINNLEEKFNINLHSSTKDFNIYKDNTLNKPFKKRDVIKVKLLFPGRYKNEYYGINIEGKEKRIILVKNLLNNNIKETKVRIIRDKHNIFFGVAI